LNFFSPYKRKIIYFLKKKINLDNEKNNNSLSLDNLLIKYGSDKATLWNNNKGHGYTKFYIKHFNKIRKKN
jgi:hypothetical protein